MMAPSILVGKFYRLRSHWWRENRMLFPSPAELRLLRLMGGKFITFGILRHPETQFSAALILSRGKLFRTEMVRREVRVGSRYVDFGNDLNRAIEVDGAEYHGDIVKQVERDEYFAMHGWHVLHIRAADLWREPNEVQRRVLEFLTN